MTLTRTKAATRSRSRSGRPEPAPEAEPGEAAPREPDDPEVLAWEEALVARARRGDRRALQRLLEQHAGALYSRVIVPRTGDPAVAEDILKATLVTAMEKLDSFRWQGRSIYHWLRRIAVNKVVDHHRRSQRTRRLGEALAAEPEADVLPSRHEGPEEALLAEEERRINRRRLERALEAVNPRYRRAVELRLVQELSREECARRMEVTVGTFDVVLYRALRALRRSFGDMGIR